MTELDTASPARVYDYWLGGSHNFAADREVAAAIARTTPDARLTAWANRSFLRRAVRELLAAGITRFLDLGSGIPTVGNVHEVAQAVDPAARVVYVDRDPVAVQSSRELLDGVPGTAVVDADLREPERVLGSPEVRELLAPQQPIALMFVSVLHFVPDRDRPAQIIARYREALAPGSHLVISHGTLDGARPATVDGGARDYASRVQDIALRGLAEVTALFDGCELLPPGVVRIPRWRPTEPPGPDDDAVCGYAGMARITEER